MIANEYIANVYDDHDDSMQKWKDFVILSIDGSKIVVPNTPENQEVFGVQHTKSNEGVDPAMALFSTLQDSLNHLTLDMQVDRIDGSERNLAAKHIDYYCDNYIQLKEDVFKLP